MSEFRRWPVASMVVVALASGAVAATALAATTGANGGPITAVKVVRGDTPSSTGGGSWADVPGASTSISVPGGQRALITARFAAESDCAAGSNFGGCHVRILIGGVEGAPASGADFDFDHTTPGSQDGAEAHSMDRSRSGLNGLPAGTYEVKVQYEAGLEIDFTLDDWQLTVERAQIG